MMYHKVTAEERGWNHLFDTYYFPDDEYDESSAMAQFIPVDKITKRGYPCTEYRYEGKDYYKIYYNGLVPDTNS